jgi:phage terminase large subunit-like protein
VRAEIRRIRRRIARLEAEPRPPDGGAGDDPARFDWYADSCPCAHLSPAFFRRIVAHFEGTRLGRQELMGELLEVGDGAWFARFDPARHVGEEAEYDPASPVHLAIDYGVSRHTAAVWFQVRGPSRDGWSVAGGGIGSDRSLHPPPATRR